MSDREEFPLISGYLSVDLVNTEIVRRGVRHDLLESEADLMYWIETMQERGALFTQQFGCDVNRLSSVALDSVRDLRVFLRKGFERIADGGQVAEEWQFHLEQRIAKAPFSYKMILEKLIPIPIGHPADALVSLIAFDALRLLSTGDLLTLHHCGNPDCVLLFMDASGRRKWCSMKICGNRVKVARHQTRRSGGK
ncbi:CGNR zinc finger domain-containing protein [Effusibacillus dendaii]|uniref:CGNR zinc finger domain-containing protein n=1 Tax=Effusibacillus dendaii TaxID=2743772 RepID=UPI00190BF8FD|nr:CGNR zinc finger domain-containing protein [Effusibacillus dendaii]